MKKLLTAALVLTLVFALAISSSATVVQISANWTVADSYNSDGDVYATADNTLVIDTAVNGSYDQAGIIYGAKVPVNNLEIVFKIEDVNPAGNGAPGYNLGIILAGSEIGDFVNYTDTNNVMGGNTYSLSVDTANAAALCFFPKNDTTFSMFGGMNSLITAGIDYTTAVDVAAGDITVKYVVNGDNVDVYVNGAKVPAATFAKATVVDNDGKAYLAFANHGYGTVGTSAIIKTINGTAANLYEPATSGPADIEVIAIAAAMLVALAGAAFVVKARA